MVNVQILCEGPLCNRGVSAEARESHIARGFSGSREEAARYAREQTTKTLPLTPHTFVGSNQRGSYLFSCDVCAHQRVYGNTGW